MIPQRGSYSGDSYKIYDDYNEIHLFVEDAGFENLYKEILKRGNLRVRQVFSKNGKESVLRAAEESTDSNCVFLIDRDWDDFLGNLPSLSNLVVTDGYSIENYLLDYSGFSGIVMVNHPKGDLASLLSPERFRAILIDVSDRLRPLFECFLLMQSAKDPRPCCSIAPGTFQERNASCMPDQAAIALHVAAMGHKVTQPVQAFFHDSDLTKRGHGKYMLHFIWQGVRSAAKLKQVSLDQLMMHLVLMIDPAVFAGLCAEIGARAKSNGP